MVLVRERRGTQLEQWIVDVQTTGPPNSAVSVAICTAIGRLYTLDSPFTGVLVH